MSMLVDHAEVCKSNPALLGNHHRLDHVWLMIILSLFLNKKRNNIIQWLS